ncbi:MAG: hypothetical protein R2795_05465 [Saprospiraceae bacterium]
MKTLALMFILSVVGGTALQAQCSKRAFQGDSQLFSQSWSERAEALAEEDETIEKRVNHRTGRVSYLRSYIHPFTGEVATVLLRYDPVEDQFVECDEYAQGGEGKLEGGSQQNNRNATADSLGIQQRKLINDLDAKDQPSRSSRVKLAANWN